MYKLSKNFFNKSECNIIRNKLNNVFLEENNEEKEQIFISQLQLANNYRKATKKKNWQSIYELIPSKLDEISFIKKKLFHKAKIDGLDNPKIISIQCRMLDINDHRSYPLHQDWPGIEMDSLMIYWIPLHKVNIGEGCLKVCQSSKKQRLNHVLAENGYPILDKEHYGDIKAKTIEIPMKEGDCLGFDGFTIHGSASKVKGITRFALIYRIA